MKEIKSRFNKDRGAKRHTVCKLADKDAVCEVLKNIRNKALTPRVSSFTTIAEEDGQ